MTTAQSARIDWHTRAATLRIDGRPVINGQRVNSVRGLAFDCISPVDGRLLGSVSRGTAEDIDAAVTAARQAFADGRWARRAPAQRKRIMQNFAEKILAAKEESSGRIGFHPANPFASGG